MSGNWADAEDALSSAGIKASQYLATHPHEITNTKAWLTKLLFNHCMNLRKTNQREQRYVPLAFATGRLDEVSTCPVQAHPEEAALRHEMQMYVRGNVNQLPPSLREPLVLCFFGNMSQREVAAYLNLSYEVVRKRLQLARAILRKQMLPYVMHDEGGSLRTSVDTIEDIALRPAPVHEEITSQVVAIRMVRITAAEGIEQYAPLVLDHQPKRQEQKVATLRMYVQRHPRGWRKRMQLADLLYTMGHWEEAIVLLYHVLQRQPGHLPVRLRLGQMLRLLQREHEAIDVYEDALSSTDRAATQYYIKGCRALCQRHWDEAVESYAAAAALEPGHAVYWRELGLTWLRAGSPAKALQVFNRLLQGLPNDLVALTFSYDSLMAAGCYETALWRTERAWQCDSGNVFALAQLIDYRCRMGHVRGDSGRATKALIRRAIQLAPDVPEVQAARLHFHIARGEQSTGLALLRQSTAHHAHCPAGAVKRLTLDIARHSWDYVRAKTVSMT